MANSGTWRRRLLLAVLGPVIVLGLLEGGARLWLGSRGEQFSNQFWILDPDLGARMRPGFDGIDDHGLAVRINARGLRNAEVERTVPEGRSRVLALGDSVTYGFGVEEQQAWPRQLEARMRAAGAEVEVVNAGVPGYSTYQGLRFLERDLLELQPEVVLVAFMNNDRWDSKGKVHDPEGMRAEFARRGRKAWLFYNTALGRLSLRFLAGGLDGMLQTPDGMRAEARDVSRRQQREVVLPPALELEPVTPDDPRLRGIASFGELEPTVGLAARERLCERLVDLGAEHGFRVVFLNFYDHGYMCEPLRRALELSRANELDAARRAILEYFATAPAMGTSGARLMDFDLYANRLLDELYDRLGTPAAERAHYFTRRPYKHLLLHLDLEVNEVATRVARRRGVEVLELRDLAFEDYLDHIHLTPRGNTVVADRIAELLATDGAGPRSGR